MLSKACKNCGKTYPLEDFPIKKSYKDGYHYLCFPCKRAAFKPLQEAYVRRDPERRRKQARDYSRRNASAASVRARIYKYGLTPEAVQAMVDAQNHLCGLCERGFQNDEIFVDHDHDCCPTPKTCGKCIRAILCRTCNQGLGQLQESPELLRKAADYIEKYR